MNTISMDYLEYNQSSSSSSSSPLQITSSPKILTPTTSHHKKKAGRKVFKETRHPVYRGVRRKSRSKWVCEVREPNKKSRIWLGTFPDPESAAVAHDVAALALRGKNAPLNFPDSVVLLPRAQSSSRYDIQRAALGAARDLIPSFRFSEVENSSNSSIEKNDIKTGSSGGGRGGFVDEEAVFNMPVLLDSMAEGMLITPLGMKKGFNWSQYEADEGLEINLWGN